jgi:hypothetical protein
MKSKEDIELGLAACDVEIAYYRNAAQEYLDAKDSGGRTAMLQLAKRAKDMKALLEWVLADGKADFSRIKLMSDAI